MTAPVDVSTIVPSKVKPWVGLVSSLLTLGVPYVLSVSDALPQPWPVVIGLVIAVLGAVGIYKAPYKPTGVVLAPDTPQVAQASVEAGAVDAAASSAPLPPLGEYQNPFDPK